MQSVVSYPDRGRWGDNRYRGNCSGRLIEDIIRQYRVDNLCDFMVGGGTTEDVCRDMKVEGAYADLNRGYDMMTMDIPARAGNIFWHPPYGSMITYSDNMYSAKEIKDRYGFDPRVNDLSRCRDWDDFIRKLNWCCMKQFAALDKVVEDEKLCQKERTGKKEGTKSTVFDHAEYVNEIFARRGL